MVSSPITWKGASDTSYQLRFWTKIHVKIFFHVCVCVCVCVCIYIYMLRTFFHVTVNPFTVKLATDLGYLGKCHHRQKSTHTPSDDLQITRNVQQTKVCSLLQTPPVEAGKDTSTVIPASPKRRRKGNRISLRPLHSAHRVYLCVPYGSRSKQH
jgi:hypothetical protein